MFTEMNLPLRMNSSNIGDPFTSRCGSRLDRRLLNTWNFPATKNSYQQLAFSASMLNQNGKMPAAFESAETSVKHPSVSL